MIKLEEKVKRCYESVPFPDTLRPSSDFNQTLNHIVYWIDLNLNFLSKGLRYTKPKTILCAGCGTGEEAIALSKIFPKSNIDAIDISKNSLSIAKQNIGKAKIKNITLIQSSIILDLPKFNKKYDLIYSAGVIHHLSNPKLGFKILTNKLKKEGKMVIMLYNSYGLFFYKCQLWLLKLLAGGNFKKRLTLVKILGFGRGKDKVFIFDSYINPQVKTFSIENIKKWVNEEKLVLVNIVPPLDIGKMIEFATAGQGYFFRRKKLLSTILSFLKLFYPKKRFKKNDKEKITFPLWKTLFYQIIFLLLGKGEVQYLLQPKRPK